MDSNGDVETLHAEAKDNLLDAITEASVDTIEKWKLPYCKPFASPPRPHQGLRLRGDVFFVGIGRQEKLR